MISKLKLRNPEGDSQLSSAKSPSEIRKVLLDGVKLNFKQTLERCEKKFGKGNCIKFGDYSYVFKCNGEQTPIWADAQLKRFKCTLPKGKEDSDDSSELDYLGKDQEYDAVYYEILDG